jgi:Tol biopolymer transport system component
MGAAGGGPVLVTRSRNVDETPVWSPDGTRIAFLRKADGVPSVFVASATDLAEVTRLSSPDLLVTSTPLWSPDSLQVLFSAQRLDTDRRGIYVAGALGTGERPLLEDAHAYAPAWSPDGRWIAFVQEDAGSGLTGIWMMRADGTDPAELVGGLEQAGSIDWQPLPVASPVVSADALHVEVGEGDTVSILPAVAGG